MVEKRALAAALLPPIVAALAASLAAQPVSKVPEPEKGRWAATVLALLDHGHERCSDVAERTTSYWRRLSGDGSAVRESLDRYIVSPRATADLAAARKSLDIASGFLAEAARETAAGTGEVLERLYEAEEDLYEIVVQPAPPLADFKSRIENADRRIKELEAELGNLLRLDREQLAMQVKPYLDAIEIAGAVAQQEVMRERELESEKPPPPPPPSDQDLMKAWHGHYTEAVVGAKMALRAYLQARSGNDPGAIQQACRALLGAVIPLLTDKAGVFQAPDPDVEEPLSTVYRAMRRIGNRCTAGRFNEADEAYGWLKENLNKSARVLARYGLQP